MFRLNLQSLGPFVRMVIMMVSDIGQFLSIFSMFWIGFAGAFLVLFRGEEGEGYETFPAALTTLFNMMLGDSDFGEIQKHGSGAAVALYVRYPRTPPLCMTGLH